MKESKLRRLLALLFVFGAFLGLEIGGAVALLVLPKFVTMPSYYPILFFADGIALFLTSALLAICYFQRARLLEEKRSSGEFFANERFVYTESNLKVFLAGKAKRNHLSGVLAAIVVKDINSELLTLYGPEAVREINEICLGCISWRFGAKPECRYAYNMLDGFFVYKDTKNADSFYDELKDVAADISDKLRRTEALPSVKILIGAFVYGPQDELEQGFQKALFAQKFNAGSRLTDDVVVYNQEMMERNQAQRDLALELEGALEKEEFELYYQPKYRIRDKAFYGAEALIRWHHPNRGLLPPSLFIPFAEASGNIIEIDYYVFEHVCRNIADWKKDGVPILVISVNLSRKTIYNPGLLEFFKRTLAKYNIDPRLIEIELTESIAAKDSVYIRDMILKLRNIGFRTAIDDFGVGYSSFASLKRIPFDTLKVDKTFIDDIEVNERSRSMVKMVIDLGHSLGMDVVAEGVQSLRQSQILQSIKLDNIQGFYYAKPLSGFDFVRFLHDHKVVAKELVSPEKKAEKAEAEKLLSPEEAKANSRANLKRGKAKPLPRKELRSIKDKKAAPTTVSEEAVPTVTPEEVVAPAESAPVIVVPAKEPTPIVTLAPAPAPVRKEKKPFNPIVNLRKKDTKENKMEKKDDKKTEGQA